VFVFLEAICYLCIRSLCVVNMVGRSVYQRSTVHMVPYPEIQHLLRLKLKDEVNIKNYRTSTKTEIFVLYTVKGVFQGKKFSFMFSVPRVGLSAIRRIETNMLAFVECGTYFNDDDLLGHKICKVLQDKDFSEYKHFDVGQTPDAVVFAQFTTGDITFKLWEESSLRDTVHVMCENNDQTGLHDELDIHGDGDWKEPSSMIDIWRKYEGELFKEPFPAYMDFRYNPYVNMLDSETYSPNTKVVECSIRYADKFFTCTVKSVPFAHLLDTSQTRAAKKAEKELKMQSVVETSQKLMRDMEANDLFVNYKVQTLRGIKYVKNGQRTVKK
jgi:hypothetical protein